MCNFILSNGKRCANAVNFNYCKNHSDVMINRLTQANLALKKENDFLKLEAETLKKSKPVFIERAPVKIAPPPLPTLPVVIKSLKDTNQEQRTQIIDLNDKLDIAKNTIHQLQCELKDYHFIQQFEYIKNTIQTTLDTKDYVIMKYVMERPRPDIYNMFRPLFRTNHIWKEYDAMREARNELVHNSYKISTPEVRKHYRYYKAMFL